MFTNTVLIIIAILVLAVYWLDRFMRRMSMDAPVLLADITWSVIPDDPPDPQIPSAIAFLSEQRQRLALELVRQLARGSGLTNRERLHQQQQDAWKDIVRIAELRFGERATRTALRNAGFDH